MGIKQILPHAEMGKKPGILKHQPDAAPVRGHMQPRCAVGHGARAQPDMPPAWFQTRDGGQQRGLAAAGGAKQDR